MNIHDAHRLMERLDNDSDRSLDDGFESYMIVTNHNPDNPDYGIISFGDGEPTIIFEIPEDLEHYMEGE